MDAFEYRPHIRSAYEYMKDKQRIIALPTCCLGRLIIISWVGV
ncbi:MAG TPA: hypothetical protein VFV86_05110 [Nitrososphaeraceae archaeon]|nr:hypothetical protein [Nitrososphaeraceae archaeon]